MKRVVCAILSVLMLVSVLSIGAVNVSADSMTTSDAAIELLKQFEGFRPEKYADNGQYSIGYGTTWDETKYPDGVITEAEAEMELRNALDKCENTTNYIAAKHGLSFTQGQFDALVLFAYNLGYGWYSGNEGGSLYQAIVNGATGNDFIYAMTLWCKASGSINTSLVNRRLAEANMYLNDIYSKNPPASYSYVIFNGNGGDVSASIQGYDSSKAAPIKVTATYSGYYFAGWYTAKEGGKQVTALDNTTKGITLYAHWEKNEPIATGTVTASSLYVRSSASLTAAAVGGLTYGTKVEIYEMTTVGNVKWGRISNGWISLNHVKLDSTDSETPGTGTETPDSGETEGTDTVIATGTITASSLTIRKGPGTGYGSRGYYARGEKIEILEKKVVGNTTWGRTDRGWVSLSYVKLDEAETEPEATEPGATEPEATEPEATEPEATEPDATEPDATEPEAPEAATVVVGTVTGTVYLRKAPGANGQIIGSVAYGNTVKIHALQVKDGIVWGQIEGGWISLNYVKMSGALRATVNCGLFIRTGAGTNYKYAGSYGTGDKVNIYETKTVKTSPWGRTDKGWINLKYVTLDGVSTGTETPGTGTETPGTGTETPGTGTDSNTVIGTGTVTAAGALTIRRGPGVGYGVAGYYAKGTKIDIYEMALSGNTTWVRTAKGWVSLTFVKLDAPITPPSTGTETPGTGTETPGTGTDIPGTVVPGEGLGSGVIIASSLSVRNGAGSKAAVKTTISYGTAVKIYDLKVADGIVWAKIDAGWISLNYVKLNAPLSAEITASALFIRKTASMNAASVGMYVSGDKVNIYETKTVKGSPWGLTNKGWINLKYVKFGASAGNTDIPSTPGTSVTPGTGSVITTGKITANALSVRNGGSSNSAIIGSVTMDTVVNVYELKMSDGILWGRIDAGWISMNFVKLNAPLTGKITASTLNIRNQAGFTGKTVGSYYSGNEVVIYETATANGLAWGLTNKGWISLKYVELNG